MESGESKGPAAAPLQRVGPFHLHKQIGEGGQGLVWLATDVRSGKDVALKVLRSESGGPADIGRLRREAELLRSFADPGLPAGHELYEDPTTGALALAMQYIEGAALMNVAARQALTPASVLALGKELARILSLLHARGIVHRDVKPSNILLRPGWEGSLHGRVVLVDLGIARGREKHATKFTALGGAVGTVAFMAPELILAEGDIPQAHPSLDVYAAGVVLWSLLFGSHPTGLALTAPGPAFAAAMARAPQPRIDQALAAEIHRLVPGLVTVLLRCLEASPSRRYVDALQLGAALEPLTACEPPAPRSGSRGPDPPTSGTSLPPSLSSGWIQQPPSGPHHFTSLPPTPGWTTHLHGINEALDAAASAAPTTLYRPAPKATTLSPGCLGALALTAVGALVLLFIVGISFLQLVGFLPPLFRRLQCASSVPFFSLNRPRLGSGPRRARGRSPRVRRAQGAAGRARTRRGAAG